MHDGGLVMDQGFMGKQETIQAVSTIVRPSRKPCQSILLVKDQMLWVVVAFLIRKYFESLEYQFLPTF
jgi:hypothetical protein